MITNDPMYHPSLEKLYDFQQKNLSDDEQVKIEIHLSKCDTCLEEYSSFVRNATTPATLEEKHAIQRMRKLTKDEQVEKIMTYAGRSAPAIAADPPRGNTLMAIARTIFQSQNTLKLVGFAAATVLIFVSWKIMNPSFEMHKVDEKIDKIDQDITSAYKPKADSPVRFMNSTPPHPLGDEMGGSASDALIAQLRKDAESGSQTDSLHAIRVILKKLIIGGNTSEAQKMANSLYNFKDKGDLHFLVDLASANIELGNSLRGTELFKLANEKYPNSASVLYSLAQLAWEKQEQGKAIALMRESIKHETHARWATVSEGIVEKWEAEIKNREKLH